MTGEEWECWLDLHGVLESEWRKDGIGSCCTLWTSVAPPYSHSRFFSVVYETLHVFFMVSNLQPQGTPHIPFEFLHNKVKHICSAPVRRIEILRRFFNNKFLLHSSLSHWHSALPFCSGLKSLVGTNALLLPPLSPISYPLRLHLFPFVTHYPPLHHH